MLTLSRVQMNWIAASFLSQIAKKSSRYTNFSESAYAHRSVSSYLTEKGDIRAANLINIGSKLLSLNRSGVEKDFEAGGGLGEITSQLKKRESFAMLMMLMKSPKFNRNDLHRMKEKLAALEDRIAISLTGIKESKNWLKAIEKEERRRVAEIKKELLRKRQLKREDAQLRKQKLIDKMLAKRRGAQFQVQKVKELIELKAKRALKANQKADTRLYSTRSIVVPPLNTKLNGYRLYIKENISKKANPSFPISPSDQHRSSFAEVCRAWATLDSSEKLQYKKRAAAVNRQNFTKLVEWWKAVDKNLIMRENKRRQNINNSRINNRKHRLPKLVDPRTPKAPPLPYSLFLREQGKLAVREQSSSFTEFSKAAATKWKQLPKTEKETYQSKYTEAKKVYISNINKLEKLATK